MKVILKDFNYKGRYYDYLLFDIGKKDKMGRKVFKKISKIIFEYYDKLEKD